MSDLDILQNEVDKLSASLEKSERYRAILEYRIDQLMIQINEMKKRLDLLGGNK